MTISVLKIAIPLPFIARRSPRATERQRRGLGVRAGPRPALTPGAMKHTRPFIARRPGPEVTGETAPGAGRIRAPALAPAAANGDPSTRSGSGNRQRTLSPSVGVRGARATFATAVPGCGWRGRINGHRPIASAAMAVLLRALGRGVDTALRRRVANGAPDRRAACGPSMPPSIFNRERDKPRRS